MKSLYEKLQDTLNSESLKNSGNERLNNVSGILEKLESFGINTKPEYTLPMVDTIGKSYYLSMNSRSK